jgi:hypothetical protein
MARPNKRAAGIPKEGKNMTTRKHVIGRITPTPQIVGFAVSEEMEDLGDLLRRNDKYWGDWYRTITHFVKDSDGWRNEPQVGDRYEDTRLLIDQGDYPALALVIGGDNLVVELEEDQRLEFDDGGNGYIQNVEDWVEGICDGKDAGDQPDLEEMIERARLAFPTMRVEDLRSDIKEALSRWLPS